MRDWSYGINSNPEYRIGHITVYERPWWIALAEWFAWWIDWNWLHHIPLPDWPLIAWKNCDDGERFTPKDWWGHVGGMVFGLVSNPIYQWVFAHPRNVRRDIDIGYAKVREMFYADSPEFFDEEAGIGEDEDGDQKTA